MDKITLKDIKRAQKYLGADKITNKEEAEPLLDHIANMVDDDVTNWATERALMLLLTGKTENIHPVHLLRESFFMGVLVGKAIEQSNGETLNLKVMFD